jgi:hypothetical protein
MNHKNMTLAIVAIVPATALTAIPFAVPQQALAGGNHYKHNNHNSNSIKVDQQINQQNACPSLPPPTLRRAFDTTNNTAADLTGSSSSTFCLNSGDNQADIHK